METKHILAAVLFIGLMMWQFWPAISSIRLPSATKPKASGPTGEQAFAALLVLAAFKNQTEDPAYGMVLAAWKAETPQ